jgi:hypothetical protein
MRCFFVTLFGLIPCLFKQMPYLCCSNLTNKTNEMVNIFFSIWRTGSFLLSIVTLLYCYAAMPEDLAVSHSEDGSPASFMNKQTFFYIAAGIILFLNILMRLLKEQLLKFDFSKLNLQSTWASNPTALSTLLKGWFDAFLAFVNTYLVFVILGLFNINSTDTKNLDFNYNWILLVGAVGLLILIFWLPLQLLYGNPKNEND